MTILLIESVAYRGRGGEPKANRRLLEGLAQRGHECHAITPSPDAPLSNGTPESSFHHNGVMVHPTPDSESTHKIASVKEAVELFVQRYDVDRTLVSSHSPTKQLVTIALEHSPCVVLLVHSSMYLPFGPFGFIENEHAHEQMRQADGIITVSRHLQRYLKEWGDLDAEMIRFPAYDDGPFPNYGAEAGADPDGRYVLMINPCAVKGIDLFLDLTRHFPDVSFASVPTWGTTADDRRRLHERPNVTILDPVDDVDRLYRQTRVLLVPSVWDEAFGLVSVEAMLRGLPVLSSDAGGLPEAKLGVDYVLPVRTIEGYALQADDRDVPKARVPEQDVGPWVEALDRVLNDEDHYQRLAAHSRRAAHAFVESVTIDPFEDFLQGLESERSSDPTAAGDSDVDAGSKEQLRDLPRRDRAELLNDVLQSRNDS